MNKNDFENVKCIIDFLIKNKPIEISPLYIDSLKRMFRESNESISKTELKRKLAIESSKCHILTDKSSPIEIRNEYRNEGRANMLEEIIDRIEVNKKWK